MKDFGKSNSKQNSNLANLLLVKYEIQILNEYFPPANDLGWKTNHDMLSTKGLQSFTWAQNHLQFFLMLSYCYIVNYYNNPAF